MKIGIIGGTGGMGKGFALRWCCCNDVIVGSRDAGRAAAAAQQYQELAKQAFDSSTINGTITGKSNVEVAKESDVLVLSIGYENIDSTCAELLPLIKDSCVVISPIVPMTKTDVGFEFIPIKDTGRPFSHQLVQKYIKNKENLVSAFHVISEKKLADPTRVLDYDIFVCGDGQDAIKTVNELISQISGLRPLYLGPGALAYMAEIATPLLLNAMIKNKIKNPGIKIVS